MLPTIFGALSRHMIGGAGAAIAATGYLDETTANQAIGAAMFLGSVGWSLFQKFRGAR